MYKPRKQWQMYEKLMRKNLVPDEEGKIGYRLGEEQWEKDIVRIAYLTQISPEQVARKFPTDSFIYHWIDSEITGSPDCILDNYESFKSRGRYWSNSEWIMKYNRERFDERVASSPYWKSIEESRIKFAKENGMEILTSEEWFNRYDSEFREEKW